MPSGTDRAHRAVGHRMRHRNAVTNASRQKFRGRARVSEKLRYQRDKEIGSILAEICHEIRSPIGSLILAAMRLAEAGDIQTQHARDAKRLLATSEQILGLIDGLIFTDRMNINSIAPAMMEFEVHTFLEELLLLLEQKAQCASVRLHLAVEQNAPTFLISNKGCLLQVVTNLVENALRHAGCRNIVITVSAVLGAFCHIRVEDDGRGMDAARRRALMSEWVRPAARGPKRGRCGLGLRISNRLAGTLNGKLSLDATAGGGLCVTLTLPLRMR